MYPLLSGAVNHDSWSKVTKSQILMCNHQKIQVRILTEAGNAVQVLLWIERGGLGFLS